MAVFCLTNGLTFSEEPARQKEFFEKAKNYRAMIPTRIIREIKLPKGYHEGILVDGNNILVNNGENGKTWIVDSATGKITSEIEPPGTFSEGITKGPTGKYWIADWDNKKIYRVEIKKKKMVKLSETSLKPAHPTGVVWSGSNLYVITWTRGVGGTKYHLLEMDPDGKTLRKIRIKNIPEPSQITWDGKDLWISSWFDRRIYRIDGGTFEIKGYFRSLIKNTTGIAWDGKHFWATGTKKGLYQIEILPVRN